MICKDIIKICDELAARRYAVDWDRKNDGLQFGNDNWKVSKIYLAVDVDDEVLEDAITQGADMIISHHPLIFGGINQINNDTAIGRRLLQMAEHRISYFAMHTNFDVACMADDAADHLGLLDRGVLEVTYTGEMGEEGIGRYGRLPQKMSVRDLCQLTKEKFCLDTVKVFGDLDREVERVAISPGSGKGMSEVALIQGAEVLITGDIDHHTGIDAVADGLCIIDAGHYGLEHIFIDYMKDVLDEKIDPAEKVEIIKAPLRHPFTVL
jgi:dinuclear metal center YbgI/SA1388 family protein